MSGKQSRRLGRAAFVIAACGLLAAAVASTSRAGGAGGATGTASAKTAGRSISLLTRIRRPDNSVAAIQEGATLREDDEVSFIIQASRPTFVHLLWIGPKGDAVPLFPFAGGAEQVRPGAEVRIPADPTKSLTINGDTGTERILLIATQRPLAMARPDLAQAVDTAVSTRRWPVNALRESDESLTGARRSWGANALDPHPGPEAPLDFTRGGLHAGKALDPGASGCALNLEADSKGNAIASVTYRHLR